MIRVKPSSYAAYDNVNLLVRIPNNFSHQNAPARNAFSPIRLAYNNPLIIYCTLTNSSTHINSQLLYPFRYICSVVPTRWVFVFFFYFFNEIYMECSTKWMSTFVFILSIKALGISISFFYHTIFSHTLTNTWANACLSLCVCIYPFMRGNRDEMAAGAQCIQLKLANKMQNVIKIECHGCSLLSAHVLSRKQARTHARTHAQT